MAKGYRATLPCTPWSGRDKSGCQVASPRPIHRHTAEQDRRTSFIDRRLRFWIHASSYAPPIVPTIILPSAEARHRRIVLRPYPTISTDARSLPLGYSPKALVVDANTSIPNMQQEPCTTPLRAQKTALSNFSTARFAPCCHAESVRYLVIVRSSLWWSTSSACMRTAYIQQPSPT